MEKRIRGPQGHDLEQATSISHSPDILQLFRIPNTPQPSRTQRFNHGELFRSELPFFFFLGGVEGFGKDCGGVEGRIVRLRSWVFGDDGLSSFSCDGDKV